ncbi:MAG: arsenate reductase ArsC [Candidatus Marinimicrobia bacterium]|nr:arsenate reductase ArsC [Candidatus Neomarinimicrobiota bacterium]MBL7066694.1 arsenate reductase ArsC [Candidatus Neomarinimicrobiota bacterium]
MGDLSELFRNEQKTEPKSEPKPLDGKKKVLFICTGNSVRSQMAEALLKAHAGEIFDIHSAGITPAGVHHLTKKVMAEIGISMEGHQSIHVNEYADTKFDYVIPLCEVAALSCPDFPGEFKRINWYIDDPIRIFGDEERKLMAFQITRNILKQKVETFISENRQ